MSKLQEDMSVLAQEWVWPWPAQNREQSKLLALGVILKDTGDNLHGR